MRCHGDQCQDDIPVNLQQSLLLVACINDHRHGWLWSLSCAAAQPSWTSRACTTSWTSWIPTMVWSYGCCSQTLTQHAKTSDPTTLALNSVGTLMGNMNMTPLPPSSWTSQQFPPVLHLHHARFRIHFQWVNLPNRVNRHHPVLQRNHAHLPLHQFHLPNHARQGLQPMDVRSMMHPGCMASISTPAGR